VQSTPPLGGGDFSGKRYVWIKDPTVAFTKAEVIEDDEGMLTVRCEDGVVCVVEAAVVIRAECQLIEPIGESSSCR